MNHVASQAVCEFAQAACCVAPGSEEVIYDQDRQLLWDHPDWLEQANRWIHAELKQQNLGVTSIAVSAINVFRMVYGLAVEQWAIDDDMGLLQQLGLIPAQ